MKKLILMGGLLLLLCVQAVAINAYPDLVRFRQPDKKTFVHIFMKGDEKVHWGETEDGYSLITNDKGYFVYAMLDDEENMIPSKYIATEISERSQEVQEFLQATPKRLRFSNKQVATMLEIWKLTKEQESLKYSGDVVGTKRILIILMGFQDKHFNVAPVFVRNMFNQVNYSMNYAKGSVRDFYYENSYGQFILQADVVGPYVTDSNAAFYGNNVNGDYQAFAREAFIAASSSVNFSNYDNDNDGVMDGAHILFAGSGEEAGGGADCIWSHKWQLFDPLVYDSTIISTYSCSPEYQGNEEERLTNIGVICHELGHVFGSPDYYDTDYASSGGEYSGNGKWDLMSSGSWNGNGATPAHHNPYTKIYIYHWATPTVLDTQTTVIMNPASDDSASFYRINTATNNEYYLLENRQKKKFDKNVPGHGLIVYHAHSELNYWSINDRHPQKFYPVCAASAEFQPNSMPSSYGNVSTAECPFPGSYMRTTLSDDTKPWIRDWAGNVTGISLNHICERGEQVYFKMNGALPEVFSAEAKSASNSSISVEWEKYGSYKVMVVCSKDADFASFADSNYVVGTMFGADDTVVYVGTASSFKHKNLLSNEVYYYKVYTKITDSTYSNGVVVAGVTYCEATNAYPYTEDFSSGMPDCWKQEVSDGANSWVVANSALSCVTSDDSLVSSRIIMSPFDFTGALNAVMKIKLNTTTSTADNNVFSVWYKNDALGEWKCLQRYDGRINSEVMLSLPKLSNFYLISLVAESGNGATINIDQIDIETYMDSSLIVVASTNGYGTITPSGVTQLQNGDGITYIIEPNENYIIDSLYVDGKAFVLDTTVYELENVKDNHTIYVTFASTVSTPCVDDIDYKVGIYPNPASDKLIIDVNLGGETMCIIYDMSGRKLMERNVSDNGKNTLSVSNLKDGVYIVKILNSRFEKTEKLIIKR